MTDLFLALTPERVLDAVEAAGLECAPVCHPLNSFENRVYDVLLRDGTRVVAKFYRPGRWTDAQILEEHEFMEELVAEEVPVVAVRPFPGGGTLRRIDGIRYCLYDRVGGRAPDELDDDLVERLGMMAARIHNVGARRDAPQRVRLSGSTYVRDDIAWMGSRRVVPARLWPRYEAAALAIARLADSGTERCDPIRLHGDLHPGNLLVRDGVLHVLDFDDMVNGPPVQDLWLLLPGRDPDTARRREVFLEGYERMRGFDRESLSLIEALRGLRLVHYAAWLARRWHDPLFPATWPAFGTEDWWSEATADLEDVLAHAESAGGAGALPREAAPDLTNADLFWDWDESEKA